MPVPDLGAMRKADVIVYARKWWMNVEDMKRDCAERAKVPTLASASLQSAADAAGGGAASDEQVFASGGSSSSGALAADFGGMTGRRGEEELRRMAATLHVRKHAGQTNAQLKAACQRAVAAQGTLHRYVRMPGQAPAPIAPAPVSDSASARAGSAQGGASTCQKL